MDIPIYIDFNNFNENFTDKRLKLERVLPTDDIPAIRFLGVYFDSNLSFQYHAKSIMSKLSKSLYILRSVKNFLNEKARLSIYYALFHPHIIYCLPIWSVTSQKTLTKISSLQKQAIHLILNLPYNAHTEPSFKKLKILLFTSLVNFFNLQIMQKYKQDFLPAAFDQVWIKNRQRQVNAVEDPTENENARRRLRSDDEQYLPPCRLTTLSKFPYYNLPRTWSNFEDESIKIVRNKLEFKLKLKEYFLNLLSANIACTRLLCPTCHLNRT